MIQHLFNRQKSLVPPNCFYGNRDIHGKECFFVWTERLEKDLQFHEDVFHNTAFFNWTSLFATRGTVIFGFFVSFLFLLLRHPNYASARFFLDWVICPIISQLKRGTKKESPNVAISMVFICYKDFYITEDSSHDGSACGFGCRLAVTTTQGKNVQVKSPTTGQSIKF